MHSTNLPATSAQISTKREGSNAYHYAHIHSKI